MARELASIAGMDGGVLGGVMFGPKYFAFKSERSCIDLNSVFTIIWAFSSLKLKPQIMLLSDTGFQNQTPTKKTLYDNLIVTHNNKNQEGK